MMQVTLEIFAASQGGYVVWQGYNLIRDRPPEALFAGTLPEALDFMRKWFEARAAATAEPVRGAA